MNSYADGTTNRVEQLLKQARENPASVPAVQDPPSVRTDPLERIAERLAPLNINWGFFPNDGMREPIAAGGTEIDFVSWQVRAPNGVYTLTGWQQAAQSNPLLSFLLVNDAPISVDLGKGGGRFSMGPTVLEADASRLERVVLHADVPFLLNFVAGTSLNGLDVRVQGNWQSRYHTSTLTKVAAVGSADSFAGLAFVPKEGTKSLDIATYGMANLAVQGFGQKVFVVRNTGANPADFTAYGAMYGDVAAASGLVQDPEILPFTLPAGGSKVVESSIPWGLLQLHARVNQAAAAAAETTAEVEFIAQLGGVR